MFKISKNSRKFWALVVFVLVIVAAGAIYLHEHSLKNAQHTNGVIPTSKKTNTSKASSASTGQATNKASVPASSDSTKTQGSSTDTTAALVSPFGNFVSNHSPGQNGSPTSEQSVCNTTPGATCDIEFINDQGVVKDLGAEQTDSNGSAYWSWNISGAQLASGNWKITAVAKLNSQTLTTADPTPLEVQ